MSFSITNVEGPVSFPCKSNTVGIEYDATFLVSFTGQFDPVALLYNTDARLPKRGDYLTTTFFQTGDANAYVADIGIDLDPESPGTGITGAPGAAIYTVHFAQIGPERLDLSPTSRPALIEGGGCEDKYIASYDKDGKPLANSAGDSYDSFPEQFVQGLNFTITQNEGSNPATNASTYSNSVNSASWYGVAAGNGLIGKITFTKMVESYNGLTVTYWRVAYPIKLRVDGWRWKVLDVGWRTKASGKMYGAMNDGDGTAPVNPVFLDGSGGKLAVGGTPVFYPTAGYKILTEQDWTTLSLPNPF